MKKDVHCKFGFALTPENTMHSMHINNQCTTNISFQVPPNLYYFHRNALSCLVWCFYHKVHNSTAQQLF